MESELQRLSSFIYWKWKTSTFVLAKAGFYHIGGGSSDKVQCFCCAVIIERWDSITRSPMEEHRVRSPNCHFANPGLTEPSGRLKNKPMVVTNLTLAEIANGRITSGDNQLETTATSGSLPPGQQTSDGHSITHDIEPSILPTEPPAPSEPVNRITIGNNMRVEADRLATFQRYPQAFPDVQELAKSGFYYIGVGDKTKCAFCNIVLRQWERFDTPHGEHSRHSPYCPFVLRQDVGNVPLEIDPNEIHELRQVINSQAILIASDDDPYIYYSADASRTQAPVPPDSNIQPASGITHVVEPRAIKARLDTPMMQLVMDMGYSRDILVQIIEERLRSTGDDFCSAQEVVETIIARESTDISGYQGYNHNSTMIPLNHGSMVPCTPRPNSLPANQQVAVAASCQPRPSTERYTASRSQSNSPAPESMQQPDSASPKLSKKQRKRLRAKQAKQQQAQAASASGTGQTQTRSGQSQLSSNQTPSVSGQTETAAFGPDGSSSGMNQEEEEIRKVSAEVQRLQSENDSMQEQRICKICQKSDVRIVFLPCSHLVTCEPCAKTIQKCPVCKEQIKATVRIFTP